MFEIPFLSNLFISFLKLFIRLLNNLLISYLNLFIEVKNIHLKYT